MIIIRSNFPIRADARSQALQVFAEMTSMCREEPGCMRYEYAVSLEDADVFILFQEWESVDALQEHLSADHVSEFLAMLPDIVSGSVESQRYDVQSASGLALSIEDVDDDDELDLFLDDSTDGATLH